MSGDAIVEAKAQTWGGARRVWFPVIWVGLLAGICLAVQLRSEDQGVVNVAYKLAVALGVVGLAVWTIRSSGLPGAVRWPLAIIPCLVLIAFYQQLLPIEMVPDGDAGIAGWQWRWNKPDQNLAMPEAAQRATAPWNTTDNDYPAFLGGQSWPEVKNVDLAHDWAVQPPRQLWRQPIGAGWSGFAVVGPYAVTQEQRGPDELVVCYRVETGEVVWSHADPVRWDPSGGGALGGIGPRATPTIHDGRVYSHGATGVLNCLDARTGDVLWTHDTLAEHDAQNLTWGKAGSPIVVDDLVVVSVGGDADQSLVAYRQETGKVAWSAGNRQTSYASPAVMTLAYTKQIVCVNEASVTAHDASNGTVLWEHPWPNSSGSSAAASQPMPVGDDRVLLSKGYNQGAELIEISREGDDWKAKRVWKRPAVLKTKLTNVVIRDGHAYGISDGQFFQCVEIKSGRAVWRKRRSPRFGHGQIILVGDVIIVLCESGEVLMVEASTDEYRELGAFFAIDGVTWNNPAVSGSRLLVRNAEEAACFELPIKKEELPVADEGPI